MLSLSFTQRYVHNVRRELDDWFIKEDAANTPLICPADIQIVKEIKV